MGNARRDFRPDKNLRLMYGTGWVRGLGARTYFHHNSSTPERRVYKDTHNARQREYNRFAIMEGLHDLEDAVPSVEICHRYYIGDEHEFAFFDDDFNDPPMELREDVEAWLTDNTPSVHIEYNTFQIILTFDSERDFILFKLFWIGNRD